MIALDMRQQLLALLTEACKAGARWARACAQIGPAERKAALDLINSDAFKNLPPTPNRPVR